MDWLVICYARFLKALLDTSHYAPRLCYWQPLHFTQDSSPRRCDNFLCLPLVVEGSFDIHQCFTIPNLQWYPKFWIFSYVLFFFDLTDEPQVYVSKLLFHHLFQTFLVPLFVIAHDFNDINCIASQRHYQCQFSS